MGLGRYSIATASGAIVATGSANALIWSCRWTNADFRAVIERLRVHAVVTGTITTAVPYDLAVYRARSFTVAPSSNGVAATLSGNSRRSGVDTPLMAQVYTLDTAAAGVVATRTSIRSATYKWTASPAGGTGAFYVEAQAGGNPSLAEPSAVRENGVDMTLAATAVDLPAGSYFYGDADTLGYNTVYVHLSDGADPDSKAAGYVEHFVGAAFTEDAHPLARVSGASGTVIGTQFFGGVVTLLDQDGIVLGKNEGLTIRAPLAGPATGTFRVCVNLDWREVGGGSI